MQTDHLKRCDILLYKGGTLTSKLIQFGTKSEYSHVAVVVEPGIALGIESDVGHQAGVRAFDLRKQDETTTDLFRVKNGHAFDSDKVISFLVQHLGAKYDTWGVRWLGVLKAVQLMTFGKFKGANRFQKDEDYFCSELVYAAYDQAGLDIVPEIDEADNTSPGDIARSGMLERVSATVSVG